MIGVTKLLCGGTSPGDALRYGRRSSELPSHLLQFSEDKKPVVVWNLVRRCNLHCIHCYSTSQDHDYPGELDTTEAKALIHSLADFGVPVVLFSGGEPLIRPDIFELIGVAAERGVRAVLSTNGTLITEDVASRLKELGISYVGVSLDGMEAIHDRFRGKRGAFLDALRGIRNSRDAGLKVGLRFTITRHNFTEVPAIFDLLEEENIPRCCFYHLAYSGRGSNLVEEDLTHQETRGLMDLIFDRSEELSRRFPDKEILTVDNHADGPYLYLRAKERQPSRAEDVYQLLKWNGGNNSGVAIGCIDNLGDVHADQFWRHYTFGNIRQRSFAAIWQDTSDPLMAGLKNRKPLLQGRCAECRYLEICGGNLRIRAEAVYGDVWAPDPACYLSDEEIGIQ
ncbi:MAG: radical SAM protein [Chloroflexi bacterium]|nr:radical SAM protein [Chloroflexota bacterium]